MMNKKSLLLNIETISRQLDPLIEEYQKLILKQQDTKIRVSELNRSIQDLKVQRLKLNKELLDLDRRSIPDVTDHGLVRYFERVERFDIENVKLNILCEIQKQNPNCSDGEYTLFGKYVAVVKNNKIITIEFA